MIPAVLGLPGGVHRARPGQRRGLPLGLGRQLRASRPGAAPARDEGRAVSMTASIEQDIALLASRDHHEPHRVLGAHHGGRRRGRARVAARGRRRAHPPRRRRAGGAGAPLVGLFEASSPVGRAVPRYEVEVELGTRSRGPAIPTPSCRPSASSTSPGGRGQPPGAVGAARRPRADGRRDRRGLHGLGAVGALGERGRRLERLGRPRAPDALARASGIWELFVPGVDEGTHYKFEIRGRDGPCG